MTVLASGVVMATCKQYMYACTIARYYIKLGSCIRRILVLTYKLSFALKRTYALKTQPRPRPVCAIWVSRGSKPSAIANFRDKLDRWRHIRNRRGRLGTRLGLNFRTRQHSTLSKKRGENKILRSTCGKCNFSKNSNRINIQLWNRG